MAKRAAFLFVLGMLCVSAALPATRRQVQYKLTGTIADASFIAGIPGITGGVVFFSMYPAPLPDGSWGYSVDIIWGDGSGHEIYGLVPASVVRSHGPWGPLQVNISNASFSEVEGSPFSDSGDFISLEGTFLDYRGVGSSTYGNSGRYSLTQTHLDGSKEMISLTGTYNSHSATFEGTISATSGTYDLSVQGPGGNAAMSLRAGTETDVIIPPPTP